MGTTKSSETLAFAQHLRSQRTTTQDDVDQLGAQSAPRVRYTTHTGPRAAAPAAH
jgi:hypothetical protein